MEISLHFIEIYSPIQRICLKEKAPTKLCKCSIIAVEKYKSSYYKVA